MERVLQVDDLLEVAPRQLSRQRGDNLLVWKRLGEADHVPQRLVGEPPPEPRDQLSRQRRDNLGAVVRTLLLEDLVVDAAPDLPVQHGQSDVDGLRDAVAGNLDHAVDAGRAAFMADSQVPWGLDALSGTISEPAWKDKPSWYLVATDERGGRGVVPIRAYAPSGSTWPGSAACRT